MSTNYHTPIVSGAPANAAIINAPLGQLDAVIGGIGYTYLTNEVFLVDAAYAASVTATKRFKTIADAIAAAAAGTTIALAPGTYTENVTLPYPGMKIIGAGAAGYNSAANTFAHGTIIAGKINLNNQKHCQISDLTVDLRASVTDCIIGGTQAGSTSDLFATIQNVTIVGYGTSAAMHGVLLESGSRNRISGVNIFNCGHGIALRSAFANVSDCYIDSCGISGIIIKAASTTLDAHNVNLSNIVFNLGQGLIIEGFDTGTFCYDINATNIQGYGNTAPTIITRTTSGTVLDVNLVNCISRGNSDAGFNFVNGDRINMINCHADTCLVGYKNNSAVHVGLFNCTSRNMTFGDTEGQFVEMGVNGRSLRSTVARMSIAKSIPTATWTALDNLTAFTNPTYNITTGYLIVPVTGNYFLRGRGAFASNATGIRAVRFYDATSGTAYTETTILALTSGNPTYVNAMELQSLTAGHHIEIQVYQNSGGALNATTDTIFELELVEAG